MWHIPLSADGCARARPAVDSDEDRRPSLERLQAVMSGRSRRPQPALPRAFVCLGLA